MNLHDYVAQLGSQAKLARTLGVPAVLISQWANQKRPVPLDRCVQIEQATEGQVTCEELRPDKAWYWAYLRATCSPLCASSVASEGAAQ